jgi:hypothetical protein
MTGTSIGYSDYNLSLYFQAIATDRFGSSYNAFDLYSEGV